MRTLGGNLDLDADVFAEPVDQRERLVEVLDLLDFHARVLVVLFERAAAELRLLRLVHLLLYPLNAHARRGSGGIG